VARKFSPCPALHVLLLLAALGDIEEAANRDHPIVGAFDDVAEGEVVAVPVFGDRKDSPAPVLYCEVPLVLPPWGGPSDASTDDSGGTIIAI